MQAELKIVEDIPQATVIVTVEKATLLTPTDQQIYVEVRTDQQSGNLISYENNLTTKTYLVNARNAVWNASFHYNTIELVDDNITFILKSKDGSELGRHTERNLKFWRKRDERQKIEKVVKLVKGKTEEVGELIIKAEFLEQKDVISGIYVPNLSLVPQKPFRAQYNAIDTYNPNAKTNRANCFSFYDGDHVPGFDLIDIYPAKFRLPKDLK